MTIEKHGLEQLEPLVGEWALEMVVPGQPPAPDVGARVTFEWMPGGPWLIQRWSVPVPEAPDGIAIIGRHESGGKLLQHYFDQRGVARVYEMTFDNGVWTLERTKADFSLFAFAQRFTGTFNQDRSRIDGTWEIAEDKKTWRKDFDLNYIRVT